MQDTPTDNELLKVLGDVREIVDKSNGMRKRLRRRRTMNRVNELEGMCLELDALARPLRRYIGMAGAHDFPVRTEMSLKRAMKDTQYERKQLRKML